MHFNLFNSKPPLDEESVDWIFEVFTWGLQHLERSVFFDHTLLVLPTNDFFPGRANSVEGMAGLMFERTMAYAGMHGWPLALSEPGTPQPSELPRISAPSPLRSAGPELEQAPSRELSAVIPVSYDPRLLNNPEAMIAGFAQVLAHHLGAAVTAPPPGGIRNWPQTTEVLGVLLGFGVLFANTAFNYKPSSCGSCSGPPVERQVSLSQYDITYALALFCVLKDIPSRQVIKPLKGSLRGYFKRCRRDIGKRPQALAQLRQAAVQTTAPPPTASGALLR